MVDRIEQELQLHRAFGSHDRDNPRDAHLLVVYGRKEQAIEDYLHRLRESSIPRALKSVHKPDYVNWRDMDWVKGDWASKPDATIKKLQGYIELDINRKVDSWPEIAPQYIADKRACLLFCYHAQWKDWKQEHIDTLKLWIESWANVPALNPSYPLIIVLAFDYADSPPKPLWERIRRRNEKEVHPVVDQISELEELGSKGMTVSILPELGNVTYDEIEQWILKEVKPADPPAMIRKAHELLEDLDLLLDSEIGLPMGDLGNKLTDLLKAFAESNQ